MLPQPVRGQGLQQQEGARRGSAGVRCTHHHLFWHQLVVVSTLTGRLLDAQLSLELSIMENTSGVWEGKGHVMQKFRAQNGPISACWQLQGL